MVLFSFEALPPPWLGEEDEYVDVLLFFCYVFVVDKLVDTTKLEFIMTTTPSHDRFDSISPIDYRYLDEKAICILSENGFTRYKLRVEMALVRVLNKRGICSGNVVIEVARACALVETQAVYDEEDRIHHDIRALVNCIRSHVSDDAKPYVHMMATSYDIVDTANAARYRDAVLEILVPALLKLLLALITITEREANTVQVGRTHGQHAVPITFGFAIASYVSRLGTSIQALTELANKLTGKFSGAVGAYNASHLFFEDPEAFEAEVLAELGLKPAEHSTQIGPPEPLMRLLCEVTIAMGIMSDLANDMRHLQRTEIGEVGEKFEQGQVGSSTMPQKRNPINFENVVAMWKAVAGRIMTMFLDQQSEHQRDLTNSASGRTYGETIAYVISAANRLTRTMNKLAVDHENVARNLALQQGLVVAEPLYIILASLGHPDAHEKVRELTLKAQHEQHSLELVMIGDTEIRAYLDRMTTHQQAILSNPSLYTGIAAKKALKVAADWKATFDL